MKPKTNRDAFIRILAIISKSKLAERLGITRQAVGNWGDEVPESYAYRVSLITSIPIDQIIPETAAEIRRELKAST
jgi:DNA-binding XRE family transcriptional regulator